MQCKKVLSIAGFDSSGGAGIQADLKVFSAFGCYGMTVLTALPIQNTCGVKNCYPIPEKAILEQLETVFEDIIPDAIKLGMLYNREIVELVAKFLDKNAKNIPIVLDPVMVAKSGDLLLLDDAIATLKNDLIPLCTFITPNLYEAQILLQAKKEITESELESSALQLLSLGSKAVLLKGGHLQSPLPNQESNDLYVDTQGTRKWLKEKRIITKNSHGTGCTLSAALASCLALGFDNITSCSIAKKYLHNALSAAREMPIGHGHGPVHHFYHLWPSIHVANEVATFISFLLPRGEGGAPY